jgi:hypothetical protein
MKRRRSGAAIAALIAFLAAGMCGASFDSCARGPRGRMKPGSGHVRLGSDLKNEHEALNIQG